jgi:predicted negative regulator of RcsB-dependent stress response
MAEDLNQNSERFERIKDFLQSRKKIIISMILLFFILILINDFYKSNQIQKSEEASQLYQELLISKKDEADKLKVIADRLMNEFGSTPYASRAQIIFVKNNIKNNGISSEMSDRLIWVSENSIEQSIQSLSFYYLGLISLSSDSIDSAENYAKQIKTKGFQGLKFDLLGDIAFRNNNIDEAKENYQLAINALGDQGDFSRVIEYKLQNL